MAHYNLGYASPIVMARAFATLQEVDSVVKYLNIAFEINDIELVALWNEPALDPVRKEPKFQEILSRLQNAAPMADRSE